MGSEEIERLCTSMSLKEREGPVRKLQDELKVVGAQKLALCLAGKILSTDLVNREAFRSQISRIWKLRGDVEIEVITSNIYAFHFQLADDRWKVLAGGPWSFDDALIVLEEPTGMGAIKGLKFNLAEFWVQISNLPILCMTKEIGCFLGSIIGDVCEVDTGPSGDCLGKYLRVRVAIQIDKPLRRFLRVDVLGDGEETVMPIQYERLPKFCFQCGLLGHTVRGCPEVEEGGRVADQVLQYGAWLKATGRPNQPNQPVQQGWGSYSHSRSKEGSWRTSTPVEDVRQYKQKTMVGASNPSANKSVGNLDGNSQGRGRGKYLSNTSQGSDSKHLNDKHNSNLEYRPKRPDVISNSIEAEGSHKKNPEINDVMASDSVYGGYQYSLSAHFYSLNIQQGVGGIKNAETRQKQAEGSATKNLYSHKEKVTYMLEESLQPLKVGTKGQTSEEKGSKNSTYIGDSGHSVQEAGFKLDLCPPKKGSPFMLKPPLLVKNRQKSSEVKRATEGQIGKLLRPGMVLLKNFLSFSDQVNIIKTCRDLGLGPGGFYQPGYRGGASLHLKRMCLGKNWDPEKKVYEDIRSMDGATPPTIPAEFNQLVEKAIHDSCALIERNHGLRNAAYKLPSMSPDICIVNFYSATGKLGLHQDRGETQESLSKGLPVVSFSVGNTAEFLYGDERDVDKATKVLLESGDVLIFGGKSRHIFHGVKAILPDTTTQALLEETNFLPGRLNLTFRQY